MATTNADTNRQLRSFIAKFTPENQVLIRAIRRALRRQFPTANELVYDNYNFFVIGYCFTERPSDCLFSMAASANGVGLCFTHGASLPDPDKILLGAGQQTRFLRLPSVTVLDAPAVKALFTVALAKARGSFPKDGRGRLIIRSISRKQRPRQ